MKKVLTVLLVIAVMFTFSFGSAFAATYTLDDYATAFATEKAAQLGYMNSAKAQYLNTLTVDDDGFVDGTFMKDAYAAVADEFIADAEKAMDDAINAALNDKDWPKDVAADKSVVSGAYTKYDLTTKAGMKAAVESGEKEDEAYEVQAPLTKAFVEGKINLDVTKYNSTDKVATYGDLTTAQYVQKCIDEAKDAIKEAAKEKTDKAKVVGYMAAKANFDTAMNGVKTLDDEAYEDTIGAGTVDAAVEAYAKAALDAVYAALDMDTLSAMKSDDTVNLKTVATGTLKDFWEADKTDAKKGEFFGVAIANIEKVTRTEVAAISTAYKAVVADSKAAVKVYANGDATKVTSADALALLARAADAVEKYADVVDYANKLKATYSYGVKQYDDAKVDQALKAAEQLVYDDMATGNFDDEDEYLEAAAAKEGISLIAENYEIEKFEKAIEDAAKKLYKDGTKATTYQVKVSYGDDKTADADIVYLRGTYENGADWDEIAVDVIKDLKDAQSYAEIDEIMAKAAEDFAGLLKAEDAADVADAQADYKAALAKYKELKQGLADSDVYTADAFTAAYNQGCDLIDDAITVEGVKSAYAEAQAVIDNIKTKDELKDAKEAVEKQISALPYTAKLTAADKVAVKAAYDAYDAYMNMAGATEIAAASKALLQEKYDKVNELVAEAIDDKAEALNDQIDKLGYGDVAVAAKAALKAEVDALVDEAEALADEIKDVNEDYANFLKAVTMPEVDKLPDLTSAVVNDAYIKLVNASKDGASYEDMQAALDAYNKLTDRQKYEMDGTALPIIKVLESKLTNAVEAIKVKASSTAKKGSITVKWTVKGEAAVADGYQVWKSTKQSKGYKKAFTTTKQSYKNTKGLKAGTRYYYKVRAYKVVDGKNVYSDWSNKAYRVAK